MTSCAHVRAQGVHFAGCQSAAEAAHKFTHGARWPHANGAGARLRRALGSTAREKDTTLSRTRGQRATMEKEAKRTRCWLFASDMPESVLSFGRCCSFDFTLLLLSLAVRPLTNDDEWPAVSFGCHCR